MTSIIIVDLAMRRNSTVESAMTSDRLARYLGAKNIHYGWVVVAVTFLTSLAMSGAVGLPGAFILPLSREFGWDTAQISGALAIRLLLFGLMAPFAAALLERYGMRAIMLSAVALVAFSLAAAPFMTQVWQLFVLWGLLVGFGTGLTALVLGATVANRWFTQRRGLVLGVLTAASATGQLVFLPFVASLIEAHGWRLALVPSVICLVIVAIIVALFMRDRPSDLGLPPLGDTVVATAQNSSGSPAAAIARAFTTLLDVSKTGVFWVLFGSFFICGLSTNGLIQTHFIPFCADFGIGSVEAASTLAMMGIFDVVGTIGSGYLSDRYDSRWLLFWYYGLRGLALLWLPFSGFTVVGLSIFTVFYGLDWIATVPPTVKLTAQNFGRERAAIVFGWIFTGHQLGAAVSAFGAGYSRSAFLTYLPAFVAAGGACLIAAGLVMIVNRNEPKPVTA
jgi:sugar phosphate permease